VTDLSVETDAVTGAFSYSGRAIAAALSRDGRAVRTLTGHPDRAPAGSEVDVRGLNFDDPLALAASLEGVTTLYNTYWVRFPRGRRDHASAVANSKVLFSAARRAGVDRIVHISITNPSIESASPYFHGKALVERALADCGVSCAIVRPAILFGGDGVLLNNIAWLLRRFPVFAVGGDGRYRVRPIHVDDLAELCVHLGAQRTDVVVNAVGPDRPTYLDLSLAIRASVGSNARIIKVPGAAIPAMSWVLGLVVRDVLLTRDEYHSMAAGLADVGGPATGATSVMAWIHENGESLGVRYANELERHFT
jgi:nucleoside-diphosphate-sugar epimerase